ncbi:response regulator receiver modulated diguanylate cyclase/phosphodiesterase [Colwellia chukchiensis]|uniref:Response regulator receiver modulated diguanylate cyclase/phosphodiesterase n=1 Tax=Colwellia chukchiensis TaxID=641665 RepID=A0A1H7MQG7_9GAMM|nr:EAL domain-containing protein [Colwellia chukchiensis]SEL13434.1 response regulator receiver modulated diguanylate cyclase/phosphodiesterase [Colwellia chukchiensis]
MIDKNLFEQQMTALVVDDDIAHRLLLESTLSAAGHWVKSAENGKQAVEIFQNTAIDIVLMDVNMPEMDGFQACQQMRALAHGKDVPIVLITGMDDHKSIEKAFNVDATDFIIKPVNWPILGHRVSYYLKAGRLFKELRNSEQSLKDAQEIALMGTWELDLATMQLRFSEQLKQLAQLQHAPQNIDRSLLLNKLHPDDKYVVAETITQSIYYKKPFDVEYRIQLSNAQERVFHEQAKVIMDANGYPCKMLGTIQDITARKSFEKEVQHLAYFDVLTGLPNRERFKQLVNTALARAEREDEKAVLMFIDLDDFKAVNDTYGHDVGDKLLQSVAQNLKDCLRSSDFISHYDPIKMSVSRLGGDEFTLIVSGLKNMEDFENIARRVHSKLCQAIYIDEKKLRVAGSIGIAIFPDDGQDLPTLLKHADIAMYKAKELGRNGFQFYSNTLNNYLEEKSAFESRLKNAIKNGELELYYQPQLEAAKQHLVGVEALVRWNDPKTGLVLAHDFIDVAEKTDFILAIDDWVLNNACQQAVKWQKAGLSHLKVTINISKRQLDDDSIITNIANALHTSGLNAECLELDINENTLSQPSDKTLALLKELKDLGIKLAIDEFGVGFSSLNHLRKVDIDSLKLNQNLLENITTDVCEAAITKAIIDIAKTLELTIIAGGIERQEQLTWLQQHGGHLFQGYLFSKPLPVREIEDYFIKTTKNFAR